jgi:nicotinamidase-related amidase
MTRSRIANDELAPLRDLRGRLASFHVEPEHTALLVIDMQYIDASREHGYGRKAREEGTLESMAYYFDRVERLVVPNIKRLAAACRQAGVPVIYVRISCQSPTGEDASWRYKQMGVFDSLAPPGSIEREILAELAPEPGDIVVDKTTSSAFISTNLHLMLQNMGVTSLVITGVATNGCVESTTRGAGDLGYRSYLVDDATAAFSPQLHEESLRDMDRNFALVRAADEVLDELSAAALRATPEGNG